ncbi:MAG: glycosyltransferase family 2 protein [Christensenellales bacterium]
MPQYTAKVQHRYGVMIAARNEAEVIGELIKSIQAQHYPKELVDVFVVADNCCDDTARIARSLGATVYERHNLRKVGKGYALHHGFEQIDAAVGLGYYDGYLVFDADNVLDENYIKEINNVFDAGYRVVTSYRNSKNFGHNWITAGYGLWFLRESKYLNGARMVCNTSCAISGTGFLVSSEIIKNDNGWRYHLLTEDIEFTVDKVLHGEVIGYCEKAILYDEQPTEFKTSWNQRMRWTKGFYQIIRSYGAKLLRGCFCGKKFQCFDMFVTVAPATLLTLSVLAVNLLFITYGLFFTRYLVVLAALKEIIATVGNIYSSLFFFGLITLVTEWKQIYCKPYKKVLYLLTFPCFMFTYVPIAIAALINRKVSWDPIRHTFVAKVTEIRR